MADDKPGTSRSPIPPLPSLVLLVVVSAAVLRYTPLKSSRPAHEPLPEPAARQGKARARLWEDPLAAVYRDIRRRNAEVRSRTQSPTVCKVACPECPTPAEPAWQLKVKYGKGPLTEENNLPDLSPPEPPPESPEPRSQNKDSASVRERSSSAPPPKAEADKERPLFLSVFLHGGPYPDNAENRMRTRYAVLAALARMGYYPRDGEHLDYLTITPRRTSRTGNGIGLSGGQTPFAIPFEVLYPSTLVCTEPEGPSPLYILWINEDGWATIANTNVVTHLKCTLCEVERSLGYNCQGKVTHRIIGPTSSHSLLQIYTAASTQGIDENADSAFCSDDQTGIRVIPPIGLKIFSPWSTVRDKVLTDLGGQKPDHLTRTVEDDAALAQALCQELKKRGLSTKGATKGSHDAIAVIGEWDTLYGRSWKPLLEKVFSNEACSQENNYKGSRERDNVDNTMAVASSAPDKAQTTQGEANPNDQHELELSTPPKRIHFFSYLKGIDGRLPDEQPETEGAGQTALVALNGDDASGGANQGELPAGRSQLDYLRRLDDHLKRIEVDGRCQFKAIGIIGTDIYDKLLLLNALRPRFPQAIFFTTDLDALFFHPSQYRHTRNLIVASAYGLKLSRRLQPHTMPFRDSYQTALFLTTLCATCSAIGEGQPNTASNGPSCGVCECLDDCPRPAPRIYEIARSGAFDLGFSTGKNQAYLRCKRKEGKGERKEEDEGEKLIVGRSDLDSPWGFVRGRPGVALAAVAFAMIIVWLVLRGVTPRADEWVTKIAQDRRSKRVLFAILGFVIAVVAFRCLRPQAFVWVQDQAGQLVKTLAGGEPVVWFQGISVWPTELLRIAAFVMTLWLLKVARAALKANGTLIGRDFFGPDYEDSIREASKRISLAGAILIKWPEVKRLKGKHAKGKDKREVGSLWRGVEDPLCDEDETLSTAKRLWSEYQVFAEWRFRRIRSLVYAVLFFGFSWFLLKLLGFPETPARGLTCRIVDGIVLTLSTAALLYLVFLVLDATRLCHDFILHLGRRQVLWDLPEDQPVRAAREYREEDRKSLKKLRLVAARTEVVGRCIKYPFAVLLVLIIARHPIFDNWYWPPGLILIFGSLATLTLLASLLVMRSAHRARQVAVSLVRAELDELRDEQEPKAKNLREVLDEMNGLNTGAFAPLRDNPVMAALLIPTGGLGVWELLIVLFGNVPGM